MHEIFPGCIWDSDNGGYEEFCLLAYNAVWSVQSQPTFQRNISPPFQGPRVSQTVLSASCWFLAYFTLRPWRWRRYISPKRRVSLRTSRRYILQDRNLTTAVVMKSPIFWDIMLCSPLKVNRHFGGTCRLHLQLTFSWLHGVISQKIELYFFPGCSPCWQKFALNFRPDFTASFKKYFCIGIKQFVLLFMPD
jgi:hypothetical protein